MVRHLVRLLLLLVATGPLAAVGSQLAGSWKFDASRSTELSPWSDYVLTIAIDGEKVTFQQLLGAGRRGFTDTMTIDLSRTETVVPVTMWPDNRHIGAYIGGDRTKRVRAKWLDDGRILRLETDLVLATQQGERTVNTLSDYKVSPSGSRLTLTELRSTRARPVVYVFNRVN